MFGKYSMFIDHTGERFGRWTALRRAEPYKRKHLYWVCQCECGTEREVSLFHLVGGKTKSCGCWQYELSGSKRRTHGLSNSKTYTRWWDMLRRCNDPRTKGFKKYGARGIRVCERWHKFENFFADMGHPPQGMTIERIDNEGDYCPENCKWATGKEQARNKRNTFLVSFRGESMVLNAWAEKLHINYSTLRGRICEYGWSIEKALTEPVRQTPVRTLNS